MKLIFDFDHTLFSAKKLYSALKEAFLKLGVEENLFQETFEESKGKGKDYKPSRQFKLIVKQKPKIPLKKLKKEFEKILNQSKKFLYPDALFVLKKLKSRHDLILLSYGEGWFQKIKIERSGIEKFFKKVSTTRDINKVKPSKEIFQNQKKIIFVEDNPSALAEIKKAFPRVITVRINRREGKYSRLPTNPQIDFSIKNLKELEKILKSLK